MSFRPTFLSLVFAGTTVILGSASLVLGVQLVELQDAYDAQMTHYMTCYTNSGRPVSVQMMDTSTTDALQVSIDRGCTFHH